MVQGLRRDVRRAGLSVPQRSETDGDAAHLRDAGMRPGGSRPSSSEADQSGRGFF